MTKTTGQPLQITDDSLLNEAAEFIRSNTGVLPALSDDMGIPVRFFYDLTSGRVKNPGVRPIEKILRYKRMTGEAIDSGLMA